MPYVYFGEAAGARIVRYGVGTQQFTSAGTYADYDAEVETWEIEPQGIVGHVVFRSLDMKLRHTNGYAVTITVWVDGLAVTQQQFSSGPPPGGNLEQYAEIQAPFAKRGRKIRATITIDASYGEQEIVSVQSSGFPLRRVP